MGIHTIDMDRLTIGPIEPPQPNTARIEHGVNIYWADANPELFGRGIEKLLLQCPPDKWNVRIVPAYMPGETWSIIATPKDARS